jgi:hypothetical protein
MLFNNCFLYQIFDLYNKKIGDDNNFSEQKIHKYIMLQLLIELKNKVLRLINDLNHDKQELN